MRVTRIYAERNRARFLLCPQTVPRFHAWGAQLARVGDLPASARARQRRARKHLAPRRQHEAVAQCTSSSPRASRAAANATTCTRPTTPQSPPQPRVVRLTNTEFLRLRRAFRVTRVGSTRLLQGLGGRGPRRSRKARQHAQEEVVVSASPRPSEVCHLTARLRCHHHLQHLANEPTRTHRL